MVLVKGHLPGFVGREAELTWLGDRLRDTARSSAGQMLAVRGRRGVGKSTLVEEFLLASALPTHSSPPPRTSRPERRSRLC